MLRLLLLFAASLLLSESTVAMGIQPCLSTAAKAAVIYGGQKADGSTDGNDQLKSLIEHMSEPGHERLVILSLTADDSEAEKLIDAFDCANPPYPEVIRGARWNDDPTFHMKGYTLGCWGGSHASTDRGVKIARSPVCFGLAFMRASVASSDPNAHIDGSKRDTFPYSLLARSHFGDLQFLHAMASPTDRNAEDTYQRMMGWAELAYGVSIGDQRFKGQRKLNMLEEVPAMKETFKHNGWSIAYLFDDEGAPGVRANIAFGSLLHMVADSFAPCHALRDPTSHLLVKFYGYGPQDKVIHKECDKWTEWMGRSPSDSTCHPVSIGRALNKLRSQSAPWSEAKAELEKCLSPTDPQAKPSTDDDCLAGRRPAICNVPAGT